MTRADVPTAITATIEDYLKAIYVLRHEAEAATTSQLAEQLGGLSPSSVTGMIKKLAELRLVAHVPYQGVQLTAAGEKIALEVLRHHRLIELYLVEALGFGWDEVHDEAEVLEHYISEKFEARIAARLGDPTFDCHGDPIPALNGAVPTRAERHLADLEPGAVAEVVRVSDQHVERLRYVAGLGIVPGARVEVLAVAPFDGPMQLRAGPERHVLDRRLARKIFVAADETGADIPHAG